MESKTRPGSDPTTQRYLKAAQAFLVNQNFEECRRQARKAQESNPNHPGPAQIIAVADVISTFTATISAVAGSDKKSDYYGILGVPQFTSDLREIKEKYEKLAALLNPKENQYPLSTQASRLVFKAWRTLSDPISKAEFDQELRMKLRQGNLSETQSFWTVCPHCFHLYEYDLEYENCLMKCQNEMCRRVFTAAALDPPPPPEVIEKGVYDCLEVVSIGVGDFVGMKKRKMAAKSSKKLLGKGVRVELDDPVQL